MSYRSLLRVGEMYEADQAAVRGGVSSLNLMEAAGKAVAREVERRWPTGPVAVMCGPGNNGGDGFVAARHLAARGRVVRLALWGDPNRLKGDARLNAGRWDGASEELAPSVVNEAAVVVDALFGAGLTRPVDGVPRETLATVVKRGIPCLAVDMPSGVHGDSGAVLGFAAGATATVTFFRRKPGHLLLPGRMLCGETRVADIGISPAVLEKIAPQLSENHPSLWGAILPVPSFDGHKYQRGMALVSGGVEMTGAARLAARAALRIGAGLVAIVSPPEAVQVYRNDWPSLIVWEESDGTGWERRTSDRRVTGLLIGPGAGVSEDTRDRVRRALASGKTTVLDADALTAFEADRGNLFGLLHEKVVLTPHEGEFRRLFRHEGGKLDRALAAAAESGAVVLLKGADTVVAAPDGRAVINTNGTADLATAGSGDVLAGFLTGLVAQGMPAFDAACAAVWLHGAAGEKIGAGLMAEDLSDAVGPVLGGLRPSGSLASPTAPIV